MMTDERTLNISEAAEYLGVARETIYRMIRDGELTTQTNPVYKRQSPGHRIPYVEVQKKRALIDGAALAPLSGK